MKKASFIFAVTAVLANVFLGGLQAASSDQLQLAHRDERLEQAVGDADASVRAQFEQSQLLAQVGHKLIIIGREAEGRARIDQASAMAKLIPNPLLRDEAIAHLANEIASTENFEEAFALRALVKDLEVRTKLGWKLANKLGKAGEVKRTQALLDEMLLDVLTVEDDLHLRAELLAGTGANHRFTDPLKGVALVYEAYGIAQAIDPLYERGLFFNEIGANLMDIDHHEQAARVFERSRNLLSAIESPLDRARFLAMLGGEQAEKGKREAATRDLELGVKAAREVPAGEERNDVLSELARNLGQSYHFERGIEVADSIPDPYHRVEGYIRIAKNMHRQNRRQDALTLLDRAEQLAAQIESAYRRGLAQRKLASEWISLKDLQRAGVLLDNALAAAQDIKPDASSLAANSLAALTLPH